MLLPERRGDHLLNNEIVEVNTLRKTQCTLDITQLVN